jgi:NitT/TauT family transport system permease protein
MQAQTAGDTLHAPGSAAAVWRSPALRKAVKIAASFALFLLFWEAACHVFVIPEFALPAPSVILDILIERHDLFLRHSLVTFYETIAGFAIAVVFGVLAAAVIVMIPALADVIMPILLISQLVPKVAIAPLLLIWFGYGLTPKVFIAFLIAFFPIVVNTASGLAAVDKPLLDLARSLEATRFQIFRKLRLPTALPELFSGMKIAMTLAVIGAIIGEFVGGSSGLGYLIIVANSELNTPLAFASLLLLSAGGIALYALVEAAERIFVPWSRPAADPARLGGG